MDAVVGHLAGSSGESISMVLFLITIVIGCSGPSHAWEPSNVFSNERRYGNGCHAGSHDGSVHSDCQCSYKWKPETKRQLLKIVLQQSVRLHNQMTFSVRESSARTTKYPVVENAWKYVPIRQLYHCRSSLFGCRGDAPLYIQVENCRFDKIVVMLYHAKWACVC